VDEGCRGASSDVQRCIERPGRGCASGLRASAPGKEPNDQHRAKAWVSGARRDRTKDLVIARAADDRFCPTHARARAARGARAAGPMPGEAETQGRCARFSTRKRSAHRWRLLLRKKRGPRLADKMCRVLCVYRNSWKSSRRKSCGTKRKGERGDFRNFGRGA